MDLEKRVEELEEKVKEMEEKIEDEGMEIYSQLTNEQKRLHKLSEERVKKLEERVFAIGNTKNTIIRFFKECNLNVIDWAYVGVIVYFISRFISYFISS